MKSNILCWCRRSLLVVVLSLVAINGHAQRVQQRLGRGVVAVQNGGNVFVSWRRMAQEPENATYNVYAGATKLNSTPLKNTNFSTTTAKVPAGTQVSVTMVSNGVESEKSVPFVVKNQFISNIFVDISFAASPLPMKDYSTNYVWPCDLDGDGEMDYVVSRMSNARGNGGTDKVEAYLRDGTFLWSVDLGVNEWICTGQNDQVLAYDINCDGKGEVIIQSSEGTRFWDKANGTFGKYVLGKSTPDIDGDGVVDYYGAGAPANANAPRYISIIDGMTGAEMVSVEETYNEFYNRTNKAALYGDEYNKHCCMFGIAYLDGVHPSLITQWCARATASGHHYYNDAFGYDFSSGEARNFKCQFQVPAGGGAIFHSIRIADPDMDGRDEMIQGGGVLDDNGTTLSNVRIAHGDRFRTTDINPEIPGLETFAIQQDAGDMLGQILYRTETGEPIRKWYLSAVGDVGRGDCFDITPDRPGWEMFSTMGGVYDANGDLVDGLTAPYPSEAIWWDGELDREMVNTADSHYNVYINDFFKGRIFNIYKDSNYGLRTVYAKRAAFWGDIIGDWREELVLLRMQDGVNIGITGLSTSTPTSVNNIYCLQEDPAYRLQCTVKGYYSSPNPGFYLGYGMPRPPLPPVMVTDLVCKADGMYTNYERSAVAEYKDGMSVMFDLYSAKEVAVDRKMAPGVTYLMPVKGQTITFGGAGEWGGESDLWKSQNGTAVMNVPITTTGTTYISEGTLESYSRIDGALEIRAKGTLAGAPTVKGKVTFERALNYEGGRLMPNGTMTFAQDLKMDKRVFIEMTRSTDLVAVKGNLSVTGPVVFSIMFPELTPGKYKLIEFSGEFSGKMENFSLRGVTGLSCNIVKEDHAIYLVINEQREASDNVQWTGAVDGNWDYQTSNFAIDGESTEFVAQDKLVFGDDAVKTSVSIGELMPTGGVTFENKQKAYTFSGNGGFSGEGGLTFNGTGNVTLNNTKSDYTGPTVINSGAVTVKELADGGVPSSFGAATSITNNLKIGKAKLIINNSNTATDRGITLTDTATIQVASGTTSFKGIITGKGALLKTGNGQLNITYAGSNSWARTILQAGTLAMGSWNTTFGTATSPIQVTGNSTIVIFDNNTSSAVPSIQNVITIDANKTLTLFAGSRCAIKGSLLGKGTYKISFPYVRGDVYTNCSMFEGTYDVLTSNCRFVQAMDLSKATLKLEQDAYAAGYKAGNGSEQSYAHKIGAIAGSGMLGTGSWSIGYLGKDDTFAGAFNSAAVVTKVGEGSLSLTGVSDANITVSDGSLLANNTAAAVTNGSITVKAGALLAGTGKVKSATIQRNGYIGAGKSETAVGVLTVNESVNVLSGGKIRIRYRSSSTKTTCDAIKAAGTVKLVSPVIEFSPLKEEYEILDDSELKIFSGTAPITITGTVTISPEKPKEGYLWDTSTLAEDGTIRIVADPDGVSEVSIEDIKSSDAIYDVAGRRVQKVMPNKVYIINGKKVSLRR